MEFEEASMENPQIPNHDSDDHNNSIPHVSHTNGDGESEHKLSSEEVKGALEITASTGKFWQDWEELKRMLYFQLKQVLSEYPEATMDDDQQNSALGESYLQLEKRLEEALSSFVEGPPFTLQRLSEILLSARTIYPKLSKLALALEKTLLVTSTLTKSLDPYPPSIEPVDTKPQHQSGPEAELKPEPAPALAPEPAPEPEPEPEPQHSEHEQSDPQSGSVENGQELTTGDRDEIMTEADAEAEADGGIIVEMETFAEIITTTSDTNPNPASTS